MLTLDEARRQVRSQLSDSRTTSGHWEGELSSSALSTATAVMALWQLGQHGNASTSNHGTQQIDLIKRGLLWLRSQQNPDGGWGDTCRSLSNISTTMLVHATLKSCASLFDSSELGGPAEWQEVLVRAEAAIRCAGGVPALLARYGKDHTFSIPILTHCALAGVIPWSQVASLPFELACLPANFYRFVRMPVVSYALPALIAIGQVRFHFRKPWNPLLRVLRSIAIAPSLRVLDRIQPASGGFLEAIPLTSFVVMSLAAMGLRDHTVVTRGVEFLTRSIRDDGSWPIDTNLATWVTTLSINALGPTLPHDVRPRLRDWLLNQQWREVHPYTNANPGGWAWTDLTGGVPDADDTPGAILALIQLAGNQADEHIDDAIEAGLNWLLDLQNRDGGWPTFCRGWGLLPFDRSAPDLTGHVLRATRAATEWRKTVASRRLTPAWTRKIQAAESAGFAFLEKTQRADGSWQPLWFGNHSAPKDENPTYGTGRVLLAYADESSPSRKACAQRGITWLVKNQNPDGGFGGGSRTPSSLEESAIAIETLATLGQAFGVPDSVIERGLSYLMNAWELGKWREPSPIGFYFAKLWYFEKLYPLTFLAAALERSAEYRRHGVVPQPQVSPADR